MRELKPYHTSAALRQAVDNGGRFYNIFSQSDDQVVTAGELAKAAGVFTAGINAFLFLEMSQQELNEKDRESILSLLNDDLRRDRDRLLPLLLSPSSVEEQGEAGRSVIVTGYPRFVENKTQFTAFIFIPIQAGKVMTFTMVPIFDQFDVYEVFDDREMQKSNTVVATVRGKRLEHQGQIRFGGVLRKLQFKDKTENAHKLYLETVFYTKLAAK